MNLEQRVEALENKVAELERQLTEQPKTVNVDVPSILTTNIEEIVQRLVSGLQKQSLIGIR